MKRIITAFSLTLGCALAHATPPGHYYLDAGVGKSKQNISCFIISCETSSSGFKLTGGYQLTPYLATELNYIDFGTARNDIRVQQQVPTVTIYNATEQTHIHGLGFGATASTQLAERFGLKARLGVMSVSTDFDLNIENLGANQKTTTQVKPYLGLGASVDLQPKWALGLDFDTTKGVVKNKSTTARLISLTSRWNF